MVFLVVYIPGLSEPILASSGSITIDWEAGTISLDSTFTAGWSDSNTHTETSIHSTEMGVDRIEAGFAVSPTRDSTYRIIATFDPLSDSFSQATFELMIPILDASLSLSSVLEPGALGASLDLTATGDSILRSVSLGFNLDSFGAIQTTSCTLPFSYAEARFSIPLDDRETSIDAEIRFDCSGFSELSLSTPRVGGLPLGVTFGAFLTFTTDEKTLEIVPSLNLANPDCFDFYTGVEWDGDTNTLSELRFYGMGVRCEIGDIAFRMLYALDPNTLALVKSPYKSLLGLVWPLAGCCGQPGEGSLAFFFGDDNLFDLGEIDGELILPVSDTLTLSILVKYPMIGLPTFTLGWQFAWN